MVETLPVCAFCHYAMREDGGALACDFCDGPRCSACVEPLCPAGTCTNKQCPRHGRPPLIHRVREDFHKENDNGSSQQ